MFDNTRAGNADIDDGIRLGYAVESACHERVVVRCIAENNEFCASKAVVLFACLRRLLDDLTHQFDSIHVDTGFGRAKVDGAADKIRNSQCLRDRTDQKLICCRHTFAYQSGIAAEEIDADFFAARSRVCAIVTKSSGVLQAAAPTKAIGVTEILLFTIGIPNSPSISSPTETRFLAVVVILS